MTQHLVKLLEEGLRLNKNPHPQNFSTLSLDDPFLGRCFQGVFPSTILTCNPNGIPNISFLSQVHRINESQIGITTQFFNKTKKNLKVNKHATLRVIDPETFNTYEMRVKHSNSIDSGKIFDDVRAQLEIIAKLTGATSFFKLECIEVFDVIDIKKAPGEFFISPQIQSPYLQKNKIDEKAFHTFISQMTSAKNLDDLMDEVKDFILNKLNQKYFKILLQDPDS